MLAVAALGFLASCIRDSIPDCPPLRVNIVVKDKNYFNVDKVELEERRAENLPFREYVPTLYWVLRDANSGKVVAESPLHEVEGDTQELPVEIGSPVVHGRYVLTVWGGLRSMDALGDDPTTFKMHRDNTELNDIYLTNDTLLFDYWHNDHTVELERTKGKLIIEKLNLPADVKRSEKKVTGLYSVVDNRFKYTGEVHVGKSSKIETPERVVNKTFLSPSLKIEGSLVSMDFIRQTEGGEVKISPNAVDITMDRNRLTVIRYVWDPDREEFWIYVLVNDNWELVKQMEVE